MQSVPIATNPIHGEVYPEVVSKFHQAKRLKENLTKMVNLNVG
jgi:hypothetical protein